SCLRLRNITLAFLKTDLIYPENATRYLNSQAPAQNATAARAIVSTPKAITGPSGKAFTFRKGGIRCQLYLVGAKGRGPHISNSRFGFLVARTQSYLPERGADFEQGLVSTASR